MQNEGSGGPETKPCIKIYIYTYVDIFSYEWKANTIDMEQNKTGNNAAEPNEIFRGA